MLGLFRITQKHLTYESGYFIVFGINLGEIWEVFGKTIIHSTNTYRRLLKMRKRNFKGRCTKRYVHKCTDICHTYDSLQEAYADVLSQSNDIEEFRCNVYLKGLAEGDYTTDFICTKTDGTIIVRECIYRSRLIKPMHYKLLEASRSYWRRRGVTDWGIVINDKK